MTQRRFALLAAATAAVFAVAFAQVVPLRPPRPPRPPDPINPPITISPGPASPDNLGGVRMMPARPPMEDGGREQPAGPTSFGGLAEALEWYAKGKPVPVVVFTGYDRPMVQIKGPVATMPIPQALHTLAAGAGSVNQPVPGEVQNGLRVYRAGGVYTFGPEYAVAYNLDVSKKPALDCVTPSVATNLLLRSLTIDQMASASAKGLGFDAMTPTQKALWRSVLRVPYTITRYLPPSEDGRPVPPENDGPRTLNPETVRLRVHPAFRELAIQVTGPNRFARSSVQLGQAGLRAQPGETFTHSLNYRLSFDLGERVAMKEKPSHLPATNPAMARPLGKSGSLKLPDFLALAGKTTGFRFLAPAFDENTTLWLGAPDIIALDALRALAVANNGTWRRVGGTYFLVESLAGPAAEDLALAESASAQVKTLDALESDIPPWKWQDIVPVLKADQSLAPGPTQDQLIAFTVPDDDLGDIPPLRRVRFKDMTPEQKAAIRAQAAVNRFHDPIRGTPMPVTDELLDSGRVTQMELAVFLDIRGVGSARMQTYQDLAQARYQRMPMLAGPTQPSPPSPTSVRLQQAMKGVAVPPLAPAEWDRLLAEMPKRGLNTLYVPVLWDGKALFPTPLFPSQSGRSEDTLSYVTRKAKAAGVRTVGVINVLAWRNPTADPHWLDKSLGWVDLDAMGRGRRRWALKYPERLTVSGETIPEWQRDPLLLADFVNPRVPEVRAKLVGLAQALRKYTDLSAVALAHWSRGPYSQQEGMIALPALGFHPASRDAFVKAFDCDPMDIPSSVRSGPDRRLDPFSRRGNHYEVRANWSRRLLMEDRMLFQAILGELEQTWDGNVEAFAGPLGRNGYMDETARPVADRVIVAAQSGGGQDTISSVAPPASIPGLFTRDRKQRLETFARDLQGRAYGYGTGSGVILDFTGSPDLLWDGLALVTKGE